MASGDVFPDDGDSGLGAGADVNGIGVAREGLLDWAW